MTNTTLSANNKANYWKGLILTFAISIFGIFYFFGEVFKSPNQTYFASSGDGFQTYYATAYHVLYDTAYFHQQSINYPYGENVLFTGCQPAISNFIKLAQPLVDLSTQTTAITNLVLLFSICISSIFIFLIINYFGVNWLFSALTAGAITFLSPQMNRLLGHFTLSYQFAIPFFIYILLKFYEEKSWRQSFIICIVLSWLIVNHLYYIAFFLFLAIPVHLFLIYTEYKQNGKLGSLPFLHMFVQLVIPFIIVSCIGFVGDHPSDRTILPWGFLENKSRHSGILFPFGLPYENLFRIFWTPKSTAWEGLSYIGLIAIVGCIFIFLNSIKKLSQKRNVLEVTNYTYLNIIFWASVIALMYSFGLPFILGIKGLVKRLPFITQMRGIGRFAWLFFYVINIISIIMFYHYAKNKTRLYYFLICIIGIALSIDGFYTSKNVSSKIINVIPDLEDIDNSTQDNRWFKEINIKQFQAILPIPFYHIGSENIWLGPKGDIIKHSFIVSLKTGLTLMSTLSSRTSISETYKHVELFLEMPQDLSLVAEIKDQRPVLIIADSSNATNEEKEILQNSKLLHRTAKYSVYSFELSQIPKIISQRKNDRIKRVENMHGFVAKGFMKSDSLKDFIYLDFNNTPEKKLNGIAKWYLNIYDGNIPVFDKDSILSFSFWFKNFKQDIYPRSFIEITSFDKTDTSRIVYYEYMDAYTMLKGFRGDMALLEGSAHVNPNCGRIKITICNHDLLNEKELIVDDLLIRPTSLTVCKKESNTCFLNNRLY